jgi:MULE transposase domain
MSNSTTNTIRFFLCWVKEASPVVQPAIIMTDCDQAQMAAIDDVYPESQTLLCTWHVLRAMRSHFATNEFPALWEKIKAWVNTDDLAEFYQLWGLISSDPSIPQSVVQYLTIEWLKVPHLWSKVARKGWNIFEEGDTNMLIEAYVYAATINKIR